MPVNDMVAIQSAANQAPLPPAMRFELTVATETGPQIGFALRLWVKTSWYQDAGLERARPGAPVFLRLDGSALRLRHIPRPGSQLELLGQVLEVDHRAGPQLNISGTVRVLQNSCCTFAAVLESGFVRLDSPEQAMNNAQSFLDSSNA